MTSTVLLFFWQLLHDTPPPAPAPEISVAAVGDVMLGTTYPDERLPPDDGATLLAEVTPILAAADLAFGNLEGPLADGGDSVKCGPPPRSPKAKRSCYAFRVPTRYAAHLQRAGFDVMSLANNHAMDFGEEGRASSVAALEAAGIAHSGAPGDIARLSVKGRRVAVIAFATYRHSMNLNDLEAARAIVAAEVAASDLVVVSFHGGAEGASKTRVPHGPELFYNENRGDLRVFARAMIDAGAALVLGHGPHVVRGLELYKGRLIAYSLGNFATWGAMNVVGLPGISLILEVRLAPDGRFLGGRAHPVVQRPPGGPRLDPERRVIPLLRQLSIEDFGDAAPEIADDGSLTPRSGGTS
jgi:poly-gamma-glutamate capsule biosynthesis protein CapA/YwtB (metallophosphatase superfamily)